MTNHKGFSTVEILISISIFSTLVIGLVGAISFGLQATAFAGIKQRATLIAQEGVEAVRNMRDTNYTNLTDGAHGITIANNTWGFSGTQDINGIFTRSINISTIDSLTKQITATVTWPQGSGQLSITQYLTNWQTAASQIKNGMAVFANGGNTSNRISYQILNATINTWGSTQDTVNVDTNVTNKIAYYTNLTSSSTRNEKVLISRHYDGTSQYIYSQVWNGTAWGNLRLLSSWVSNQFLDVQNFSGTYLNNGDFLITYSDNTATPKFIVWNGTSWGVQTSMQTLTNIPVYIVTKARPSTNEIMSVMTDQSNNVSSTYFSGGTYVSTNWSAITQLSTAGASNNVKYVDFDWSKATSTVGAISFNTGNKRITKTQLSMVIWTANGLGGGSFGTPTIIATLPKTLGSISINGRIGTNDFMSCAKDVSIPPVYTCIDTSFTPAVNSTTVLTNNTDSGIQSSFALSYFGKTGNEYLSVYSDNTTTPKYNEYTSAWSIANSATPALTSNLATVLMSNKSVDDDIMIFMSDYGNKLYSVVWSGNTKTFYTSPTGLAFATVGTNGPSVPTTYWYSFAWDN